MDVLYTVGLKSMIENDGTNFTVRGFYLLRASTLRTEIKEDFFKNFFKICLLLSFQFDIRVPTVFAVVHFVI